MDDVDKDGIGVVKSRRLLEVGVVRVSGVQTCDPVIEGTREWVYVGDVKDVGAIRGRHGDRCVGSGVCYNTAHT